MDATRAYASGEGRYSKTQKTGVLYLHRFAYSGSQSDYDQFRASLLVPRGDRDARVALERRPVDTSAAAAGFLTGQNHPDDVPSLIALFRLFSWWGPFAAAVEDWREADRLIGGLIDVGERLKGRLDSGGLDSERRAQELEIVDAIEKNLTAREDSFSTHMGEAARTATMAVMIGLSFTMAGLWIIGVAFAIWLFRQQLVLDRELLASGQRFQHMALHDPLTGLPNRVLFQERLEEAVARIASGELSAVLSLDLDQFKSVNDTLGHPVGDALLQAVTERVRRAVQPTDTLARLGGDEFAIVQRNIGGPKQAITLATRVLEELGPAFHVGGHHVSIAASIGVALAPTDGSDPVELLKNADIALYQAKSDGRNRYRRFERAMDAHIQERRELELELRRAVARNELELFFQPLVNLQQERISGFEALLRWPHSRRGTISPADFIPLAEESGLIIPLGRWVLDQACALAASWPEPLKVAVNISAVQFRARTLVQTVTDALRKSGLAPVRLELEITESVMMQDFESVLNELRQLKALGVSIAMDDFGTGYSSLNYLRRFPFDKVKIDRSFVSELGDSSDCIAIIRGVIGMCRSLDVTVTAEGVETERQLTLLRAENCTEIQGYLVSKPRPALEIPRLISDFDWNVRTRSGPSPSDPVVLKIAV